MNTDTKQLYTLFNKLNNPTCKEFAFLHESLSSWILLQKEMYKNEQPLFKDSLKSDCNSFICFLNNREYYFTPEIWDALFKRDIEIGVISAKNEQESKPQKYDAELSLKNFVNKAVDRVFNNSQTKTNEIYLDMFNSNPKRNLLKQGFVQSIELLFFSAIHKNKKNIQLELKYTSFASKLGVVAFDIFSILNPRIYQFTKDLSFGNISYKNALSLSFDSLTLLDNIFKALIDKDDHAFNSICFRAFDISNSKIQGLLKKTFKYLLLMRFKNNSIASPVIRQLADNLFKDSSIEIKIRKDYKQVMLDLGSCICGELVKVKLFKEFDASSRHGNITLQLCDSNMIINLFNKAYYTKPILSKSNIENLIKTNKKEDKEAYKMIIEQHYRKIHPHKYMSLSVDNPEVINNLEFTKYSIDRQYLETHLNFVYRLMKERGTNDIIMYFNMFNINIGEIATLSQNATFVKDLAIIIDNSLDLNDHMHKEFYEDFCKKTDYEHKNTLEELFLNMRVHKVFYINYLNNCVYLSQFRYFMHTSFLDTRSRVYNNAVYTNVQNYKMSKMIIKLYKPKSHQSDVEIYHAVMDSIECPKTKAQLKNHVEKYVKNDVNGFKKLTNELYIENIQKYLSSNVSYEELKALLNNDDILNNPPILLDYLAKNLKSPKELFFVHSMICHMSDILKNKADPHIALWYGLDAKCSGLQMLAMLFRSLDIGVLCNLMGTEKVDVYTKASEYLINLIEDLRLYLERYGGDANKNNVLFDFINKINGETLFVMEHLEKLCLLLKNTLPSLSNIVNCRTIDNIYDIMARSFDNQTLAKISDNNKEYIPYFKLLVILKNATEIGTLIGNHPTINDIIKHRELFKKAIMTYFYSATAWGRWDDFKEFLDDFILMKKLSKTEYKILIKLFEKSFSGFIKYEMPNSSLMKELCLILVDKKTEIVIQNKFFTLIFYPLKDASHKIQCTSYSAVRGKQLIILLPTNIFDKIEFLKSFPANFIHTMDSYIVHLFTQRLTKINNKTDNAINYTYNHDNFLITNPIYFKYILMDCYTELYESNYIRNIKNLTDKEIDTIITPEAKDLVLNINNNFAV